MRGTKSAGVQSMGKCCRKAHSLQGGTPCVVLKPPSANQALNPYLKATYRQERQIERDTEAVGTRCACHGGMAEPNSAIDGTGPWGL